jgi:2-C-methyl-D-erythritol 4-phosphate cytidylyltransferase
MTGASGPVALLVAAGSGERLGYGRPKALVEIAGRTLLDWSLAALHAAGIDRIVVALPEDAEAPRGCIGVRGGATRSASVRAALAAAPPSEAIVVHDAARPLAPPELFARALAALASADCAIAAARVTDTIKEADGDTVVATLDRSRLWAIQTPQAFRREALERALDVDDAILARATDDAWLVERAGGSVRVVESSPANFKITTPHDLQVAELLLTSQP